MWRADNVWFKKTNTLTGTIISLCTIEWCTHIAVFVSELYLCNLSYILQNREIMNNFNQKTSTFAQMLIWYNLFLRKATSKGGETLNRKIVMSTKLANPSDELTRVF